MATGFTDPVAIWPIDGTRVLIGEKSGARYELDATTGIKKSLGSINSGGISGATMVAIAAGANYASQGEFYVMAIMANHTLVLSRYYIDGLGQAYMAYTPSILSSPASNYEGGGWLGCGADGNLFAAIGDDDEAQNQIDAAQDDQSYAGKLVRIAPNPDPYAGASPQYFLLSTAAKGLHAPSGGAAYSGGLLIVDRGKAQQEEVDLLPATGSPLNSAGPSRKARTR